MPLRGYSLSKIWRGTWAVARKEDGAFMGRVPVDWRERFVAAFDTEFRDWLNAAAKGGAAGPSSWDGYVATVVTNAGVRAIETGQREPICEDCMRALNAKRRQMGLEPFHILPGAYDPLPEEEL